MKSRFVTVAVVEGPRSFTVTALAVDSIIMLFDECSDVCYI